MQKKKSVQKLVEYSSPQNYDPVKSSAFYYDNTPSGKYRVIYSNPDFPENFLEEVGILKEEQEFDDTKDISEKFKAKENKFQPLISSPQLNDRNSPKKISPKKLS